MKNRNIIKILKLLFLSVILTNHGCDKFKDIESGTPDQIVIKATKFYNEKNPEKFLKLLSESTIKKMDRSLQSLRMQFKTLDVQYRKDLAEKMNMDPDSLTNLKMTDYIKFNMNLNSGGMGSDNILFPINHILESDYIGTDVIDSKANVKYKGTIIHLVQEKNLWKISTFDIIHEKTINPENSGE